MLDELIGGPAAALTAVALVVAPGARASGWGARAAAALAAGWRGPRRVLLADLDLDRPTLHEESGIANDEGVIDLIEYGISVGRLIGSGGTGEYDVLPAGSYTPDPGAILRHDGWSRVLLEVAARRGTLLAWVPSDAEGVEAVVERAGAVLVLAEADEGREVVERLPHPYAVLGILTPAVAPAVVPEAPATEDAPPATEDAPPATEDPPPATEDAPPATEEAPPATEGALPATEGGPPVTDGYLAPTAEVTVETPADGATEAEVLESLEIGAREAERAAAADDIPVSTGLPDSAEAAARDIGSGPHDSVALDAPDSAGTADAAAPDSIAASPEDVAARLAEEELEERLENDPSARDALAHEIHERQRAARLAGATHAAAGIAGVANAAAPANAVAAADAAGTPEAAAADDTEAGVAAEATEAAVTGEAGVAAEAATATDAATADRAALDAAQPPAPAAAEFPTTEAALRREAKAPPPRRPRSRYRRPVLWSVGVVFLASLLAGAWHFLGGREEPEEPPAVVTQPEPAAPAAPIAANALPFVVAIEAHRELLVALNRVTDLAEIEPELLFHVEPLEREGTMFYHVMAGPVPDSTAALALRDTLIARGHKTGPTPTDVRATPLAFLIGDYGTVEGAQEQNDILRRLDIPGYVLQGTAADGAPLYRLYVGGFSTAAEAAIIRQMLQSAGIRDSLVTRTGSVMAADFIGTEGDSVTAGDSLATTNGQQ